MLPVMVEAILSFLNHNDRMARATKCEYLPAPGFGYTRVFLASTKVTGIEIELRVTDAGALSDIIHRGTFSNQSWMSVMRSGIEIAAGLAETFRLFGGRSLGLHITELHGSRYVQAEIRDDYSPEPTATVVIDQVQGVIMSFELCI